MEGSKVAGGKSCRGVDAILSREARFSGNKLEQTSGLVDAVDQAVH